MAVSGETPAERWLRRKRKNTDLLAAAKSVTTGMYESIQVDEHGSVYLSDEDRALLERIESKLDAALKLLSPEPDAPAGDR